MSMKATVEDVYTSETLRKLQDVEMEIYKKFVQICERHGFTYFALYGTMLGAIRHKGIIPWDDDIDVGMPRKDYEAFLKIAEEEMGAEYQLMNADISLEYPFVTSRVMKRGTEFRTLSMKNCKCDLGIFLDVFCIDNMADDKWSRRWQLLNCWVAEKMYILRCFPFPNLPYRGVKRAAVYTICGIAYPFMKLFPKKMLLKWLKNASSKYQDADTVYLGDCFGLNVKGNIWEKGDVFPLKKVSFEDTYIYVPAI